MKKRERISEFALSVRNFTPHALKVDIPLGYFENQPTMSTEQRERLLQLNRERVGYVPEPPSSEIEVSDNTAVSEEPPEQDNSEIGHRDIQLRIKLAAQASGFSAQVEKTELDGKGRIDVALKRDNLSIAIEVSVTTKPEHELYNVQKCLKAGYGLVWVTSPKATQLETLREFISASLSPTERKRVSFLKVKEIVAKLHTLATPATVNQSKVRGYTVKSKRVQIDPQQADHRRERLNTVLAAIHKKQRGSD